MEYIVILHDSEEGGLWAEVPALPGCFAQGETAEEALNDVKAAIASHLEALREFGESVPSGSVRVERVEVAVA
jgi:predicted RNase H-like HicB family nuclease